MDIFEKLEDVEQRHRDLEERLGDPEVASDAGALRRISKEYADLSKIVETYKRYKDVSAQIEENKTLLSESDEDICDLAREEIQTLRAELEAINLDLKILLLPKDPRDEKNTFLEIRAGTGGEEASLFVADLLRMYMKYAERRSWNVEIMNQHPTGLGGFKEIIILIQGRGAFSRMRYESGVHRVQRIPETESQGRIHTSAVTVAVLPEAEDVDVSIEPGELRIDVFRSSGPGGQSVNTTDSAVRITHIPTGIVVSCQDEKSQHKNKAKGMRVLKARLLDRLVSEQQSKISEERKLLVGSGDRSQRIRTYNFPQGRISDHRIGITLYKLQGILEGDLDPVIDPLIAHFQSEALRQISTKP